MLPHTGKSQAHTSINEVDEGAYMQTPIHGDDTRAPDPTDGDDIPFEPPYNAQLKGRAHSPITREDEEIEVSLNMMGGMGGVGGMNGMCDMSGMGDMSGVGGMSGMGGMGSSGVGGASGSSSMVRWRGKGPMNTDVFRALRHRQHLVDEDEDLGGGRRQRGGRTSSRGRVGGRGDGGHDDDDDSGDEDDGYGWMLMEAHGGGPENT